MVVLSAQGKKGTLAAQKTPFSPDEPYILDITMMGDMFAAAASSGIIAMHDRRNLDIVRTLDTDKIGVTSLCRQDDSMLVSTSRSGKATLWDVRMGQAKVQEYWAPSNSACLCAASHETTLMLGTEATSHEVSIDQWDLRKNKIITSYTELHSDDITCLSFHDQSPQYILSGSVDGLCAITDTHCPDPEEALVKTVNIGSSIHCAEWLYPSIEFSRKNNDETNDNEEEDGPPFDDNILALTHIETLSISSANQARQLYDAGDVRKISTNNWTTDYIVDVDISSSGISLLAGTFTGDFALISMTDESIWYLTDVFSTGHSDVVRTCKIDRQANVIYSGGEDGRICCWNIDENTNKGDGDNDTDTDVEMAQDGKRSNNNDDDEMDGSLPPQPSKRARML